MELTDTHCHLQFDKLAQNLDKVMAGAQGSGVSRMICVGTSAEDSRQCVELASRFDNVWAAVGAHPHDGKDFDFEHSLELLEGLSTQPRVVAFGEIGLDFYKDYSPRDDQETLFRAQLELAIKAGLPVIFHVRDAWKDFWRIMDDYSGIRAVVHSFSSGGKQMDRIVDKGWYVGLNGIMTFTRDQAQLEAAKLVPKDRLLLETDAPFLTPEPFRGQVCEPKHTKATAEFLAALRDESLEELAAGTTANAVNLFGL
jgi:TatD DNase family protein